MFSIQVETGFSASHQLRLADGAKEELHSHDWQVKVSMSSAQLDGQGLVMDFNKLKRDIEKILADFNDMQMEQLSYFDRINSSAENVAKYIFDKLISLLSAELKLEYVEVTEAPDCSARYYV